MTSATRCRECVFILGQVGWQPPDESARNSLAELLQSANEWASEENNSSASQLQPIFLPCGSQVEQVAFTPDGKYVVTACSGDGGNNVIILWQLEPWALVKKLSLNFPPQLLSISFDGRTLAAGCYQTLCLWSLPDLKPLRNLAPLSKGPTNLTFTPLGNYLVACGMDGMIRCWNVDDPPFFARFKAPDGTTNEIVCDPVGNFLACVGSAGVVHIWHLPSGELVQDLKAHRESIEAVQFGAFGKILVTAGTDSDLLAPRKEGQAEYTNQHLRFWRVSDWALQHQVLLNVDHLAPNPFGALAAAIYVPPLGQDDIISVESLNAHSVSLCDPLSTRIFADFALKEVVLPKTIAFSGDGKYLFGACGDGILLWPRGFGMPQESQKYLEFLKHIPVVSIGVEETKWLEDLFETDWIPDQLRGLLRFMIKQIAILRTTSAAGFKPQTSLGSDSLSAGTPVGIRKCPVCQKAMSIDSKFCGSCGVGVFGFEKLHLKQCLACGHFMLEIAKFCGQCGTKAPEISSPAPKKRSTSIGHKGTCQICGFVVPVDKATGLVAEHDYHQTWKFQNGRCEGSAARAFQESIDLIETIVSPIRAKAEAFRRTARDYLNSTCTTVQRQTENGIEPFEVNQQNKYIWRFDTGKATAAEAVAQYNRLQANSCEDEAARREAYVLWQTNRVKDWHPSKLIPNDDNARIKKENQAKLIAFREAKAATIGALQRQRCEFTGITASEDSMENWLRQNTLQELGKAMACAEQAFARGDRMISFYCNVACKEFNVHNMHEANMLQRKFNVVPKVSCAKCRKEFDFMFGEIWCLCSKQLEPDEDELKLEALALGIRTFYRGDRLIHVHISRQVNDTNWHDVTGIEQLHKLIDSSNCEQFDLICGSCQSSLSFHFTNIKCECLPIKPKFSFGKTSPQPTGILDYMRSLGTFLRTDPTPET